jgi:hypothetical protein
MIPINMAQMFCSYIYSLWGLIGDGSLEMTGRGKGGGRGGQGRRTGDGKKLTGGQTCVYCRSEDHYAAACPLLQCRDCGGFGHKAKDCQNARCMWCGQVGHNRDRCPARTGDTGKLGMEGLVVGEATSVVSTVAGVKRS